MESYEGDANAAWLHGNIQSGLVSQMLGVSHAETGEYSRHSHVQHTPFQLYCSAVKEQVGRREIVSGSRERERV